MLGVLRCVPSCSPVMINSSPGWMSLSKPLARFSKFMVELEEKAISSGDDALKSLAAATAPSETRLVLCTDTL